MVTYYSDSVLCMYSFLVFCVFFFKQKTAYEMRISDWSSDVCSSDLLGPFLVSTLTGSAIWTVILVLAGYELGERYSQVASVIEPVSNAVLALAVIWYLWRVATFGRSRGGH